MSGAAKLTQINTYYDIPVTNLSLTGYVQDPGFMKGAVSYTTSTSNGTLTSSTWYNYDDHGRVSWLVKQIAGLTGYKTIDYTYNAQSNVTTVDYQKTTTAERFTHNYGYDADGRLINVQTSANGGTPTQQANYYYYLHGPLKRTELGSELQGLDYVYTPQGWLKAINTPTGVAANDPGKDGTSGNAFAQDAFGMQLEYFPNDYVRSSSNVTSVPTANTNYYNGQVAGMSWQSNTPTGSNAPAMYTYTYDPKYQYNTSTYGTPSFSTPGFTATSNFAEKNIAYDANGNITGLQRTGSTGKITDDFGKYAYNTNTNQLNSVGNTAGSSIYGTYTYDQIGRLSTQARGGVTYYLTYDVTGKITAIYSNSAKTVLVESYTYDETGNRITVTNSSYTTYYVYDGSGNALAIYYGTTPTLQEVPVYGTARIGTYYTAGASYVYELRDNVGSVRVAVTGTKTGSQANVYNYEDYYPFGTKLQTAGTPYRHGYQGAYSEYDSNTQYNNFDLRMYDSRIGRWLTVDPYDVDFSSYDGMGNNPISMADPNGGDPDDINYDTQTRQTTVTKTDDDYDRFFINNVYQGWAGKGTGNLIWLKGWGGEFGIPDSFLPTGDFNRSNMLQMVQVNSQNDDNFAGDVNYGNHTVSSTLLRDRLMRFSASINRAINITGGDRSVSRNRAVGGANRSRHLFHDAADLTVNGISNRDLAIMAHNSDLFNTVIFYPPVDATGALHPHLHVDLNPNHSNNLLIYTPLIVHGHVIQNSYSPFPAN